MHCYDKYVHVLQHTARTIVVTGFDVAPGRLALTLTFACVPVGYMDGGVAVYRWDTCMASLQPRRCEQNKRGVAKPCYLLPRGCGFAVTVDVVLAVAVTITITVTVE